jgi:hypothetical protein
MFSSSFCEVDASELMGMIGGVVGSHVRSAVSPESSSSSSVGRMVYTGRVGVEPFCGLCFAEFSGFLAGRAVGGLNVLAVVAGVTVGCFGFGLVLRCGFLPY